METGNERVILLALRFIIVEPIKIWSSEVNVVCCCEGISKEICVLSLSEHNQSHGVDILEGIHLQMINISPLPSGVCNHGTTVGESNMCERQ